MSSGKEVERVAVCEANPVESLVFPIDLPAGETVELCQVKTAIRRGCDKFLILASINWQVAFNFVNTPLVLVPGFAQVTFEILKNRSPIYEVIETIPQIGVGIDTAVTEPAIVSKTTGLLHFENIFNNFRNDCPTVFSLQATNIIVTPPVVAAGFPPITATAALGAVTLVVKQLR